MKRIEVQPFKSKLKEKLKSMAEVSTVHAIPNISRTKYFTIRILWTVCFLGSFGLCAYIIIRSIVDYFKYETTVSIRRVQELPVNFPAVTFCNINPFNEKNPETIKYLTSISNQFSCFNNTDGDNLQNCIGITDTNSIVDTFIDQVKRSVADELNTTQAQALGYQLQEDMLVSCSYNSKSCNDRSNFTSFWNPVYGNCYTFNSGENQTILTTSAHGPGSGLRLELTVKPPDMESRFQYKTGLYVVVHNQSKASFALNSGIEVPTGFGTFIGINRVFNKKLSGKFSDCIDELKSTKTYQQRIFSFFNELNVNYYDQDLCFNLCYQDKLINKCNCSDIVTPKIRGANYCTDGNDIECMNAYKSEFNAANINTLCESVCPQECSSIEYDLLLDSSTFPTLSYLRYLATVDNFAGQFPTNESDYESFGRTGLLKIRVNYANNYYTVITENAAVTEEALLGNIGGQLGLFIGIGLLSFIEIFEWIIESIFLYSEHRQEIKQAKRLKKSPRLNFFKV